MASASASSPSAVPFRPSVSPKKLSAITRDARVIVRGPGPRAIASRHTSTQRSGSTRRHVRDAARGLALVEIRIEICTARQFLAGFEIAESVVDSSGGVALRGHHVQLQEPPMIDRARRFDQLLGPGDGLHTVRARRLGRWRAWRAWLRCPSRRCRQTTGTRRAGWRIRSRTRCRSRAVVGRPIARACRSRSRRSMRRVLRGRGRRRRCWRVVLRRIGGSSPASRIVFARSTCRRPAATCAPGRPADRGWRIRRRRRTSLWRRHFGGQIHRRTPSSDSTVVSRRRRGGRRTRRPHAARFGDVPGRVVPRSSRRNR